MKLPLSAAAIFIVLFGSALSYSQPQSVSKPSPEQLLLKDYRPTSIFNIPSNYVHKARYGAIDAHSHNYGGSAEQVERWVRTMDDVGIEKTIVLSGATGAALDATVARYRKFPGRFEVWCGIDYTGFDKPGYGPAAIAELERCRKAGATGVGELSDKGRGLGGTTNRAGMHIDDPRMAPILEKCAELGMPINIHVGEDRWMYEPMDSSNDGLMNAWIWKIPQDSAVLQHDEVVNTLARALRKHPRTTFVACHLANCCSDLSQVARMLDACTNLFVDIGARFSEIAPSPRATAKFIQDYQDRVLYGTDMEPDPGMYRETFRILETADEHFYLTYFRKYHWPLHALALPDDVLKKVYRDNARKLLSR